jgi:hypothetical protein
VNDEASLISNLDGVEFQLGAKKSNRGLSPIFVFFEGQEFAGAARRRALKSFASTFIIKARTGTPKRASEALTLRARLQQTPCGRSSVLKIGRTLRIGTRAVQRVLGA